MLDPLGGSKLAKSLRCSGPAAGDRHRRPTGPRFAGEHGKPPSGSRWPCSAARSSAARKHGVRYSFLFMADGHQLSQITPLVDAGVIRPVVDRVFQFDDTKRPSTTSIGSREGKVVVTMA